MNQYDAFWAQLSTLRFCTVKKVLSHRRDLESFRVRGGEWVTSDSPWFGQTYGDLSPEYLASAELRYSYYCGHASGYGSDVFFRKPTKTDKRACFIPARSDFLSRQTLPIVGEIIFGTVDEDGPEGPRFFWWNFAAKQDQNFAALLLGRETFSSAKLEKKLVIKDAVRHNWDLFLLAKALHFRDVGYFVDEIGRNGARPAHLELPSTLEDWLRSRVSELAPEFWKEFQSAVSL